MVRLAPWGARRGDEGARPRLVFQATEHRERGFRERTVVPAHLGDRHRKIDHRPPRARKGGADVGGALLQRLPRELLGVGARVPETDRHLERARSDAELGAYGDVAGAGAVVLVGHEPIRVVQLDVDI